MRIGEIRDCRNRMGGHKPCNHRPGSEKEESFLRTNPDTQLHCAMDSFNVCPAIEIKRCNRVDGRAEPGGDPPIHRAYTPISGVHRGGVWRRIWSFTRQAPV